MWAALAWGVVASLGLVLGAVTGTFSRLHHRGIALAMSLGAGLLLATAALQLAAEAVRTAGALTAVVSLVLGAAAFSTCNGLLASAGARHRKRCGECQAQPSEAEVPGSGTAIALGTALDAVPEALVLGLAFRERAVPVELVVAVLIGNLPEALSGAAGMRAAGRSRRYVLLVWGGIAIGSAVCTALAYAAFDLIGDAWPARLQAFAAGALWAMTAETMIPEAFHKSPRYSGFFAAVGFGLLLAIEAYSR
jgi:ZIP family zinc transporter